MSLSLYIFISYMHICQLICAYAYVLHVGCIERYVQPYIVLLLLLVLVCKCLQAWVTYGICAGIAICVRASWRPHITLTV